MTCLKVEAQGRHGRWLSKGRSAGPSAPPAEPYPGPWISPPFHVEIERQWAGLRRYVCLSLPGVGCSSGDAVFSVRSGESSYAAVMGKGCVGEDGLTATFWTAAPLSQGQASRASCKSQAHTAWHPGPGYTVLWLFSLTCLAFHRSDSVPAASCPEPPVCDDEGPPHLRT